MMAQAQGAAIPAKLDIERQILSQVERLPGPIESKRLGLQIMTGEIDRFGFEDYLNQASMREEGPRGLYSGLGARLCRVVPGQGLIFMSYESISQFVRRKVLEKHEKQ